MTEKYEKLFLLMKDNDEFTKNILILLEKKQKSQDVNKTEKKTKAESKSNLIRR